MKINTVIFAHAGHDHQAMEAATQAPHTNNIWIVIGIITACLAVALVAYYTKSKSVIKKKPKPRAK